MGSSIPSSGSLELAPGLGSVLTEQQAASAARSSVGPWRRSWWHLRRNHMAMAGAAALLGLGVVAFTVPWLIHIDPYAQSLRDSLLSPGTPGHWLGTDQLGRDILIRLIDGARVSLTIGLIAVGIAVTLGGLIGLTAGYFGGRVDTFLMRLMDMQLAFPGILAALVIVTVLGNGLPQAMVAVGISSIPRYARLARGVTLSLKHSSFVEAAQCIGAPDRRILFLHIVPNALGPVITLATMGLATAILSAASLSFLGLGVQPPTAEWGLMLSESRKYMRVAWWLAIFPGLAIMLTVIAINLLGDGVRDALDPYRRTEKV
jgi:peptide/nickel transport system permease protein